MYQNTRRDSRGSKRGAKGKRRHVTEESEDESGDDSEAEPDMTESKGRDKKSVATAAFTQLLLGEKSISQIASNATSLPRRNLSRNTEPSHGTRKR